MRLLQTHYKTFTADQLQTNWAPVLANLGLLLATSVQCLTTMLAAFRFYRLVRLVVAGEQQTSWSNSRHRSSSCCSSSVGSKQKLVQKWLVQQTPSQMDRPRQKANYPGQVYDNKMVSNFIQIDFLLTYTVVVFDLIFKKKGRFEKVFSAIIFTYNLYIRTVQF